MPFEDYEGAMFGTTWKGAARRYGVVVERDVRVPMPDGVELSCDIWRPDTDERIPAILSFHPYHQQAQTGPIRPTAISTAQWLNPGQERTNASLESGEPTFFARRGYAHVVCSARGTGRSGGEWHFSGPQEVKDVHDAIEWLAGRPWCDENVVMFGVSYFAWIQLLAAPLKPPHLRTIFCPWGSTDFYRDLIYRGGIFAYKWPLGWSQTSLTYARCRPANHSKQAMGAEAYREAVDALLDDDDVRAAPELVQLLQNPERGVNPFVVDLALHPSYDDFWEDRTVDYSQIEIPAYIGADWGCYGIHLPAAFRSWEGLDVPKKMIVGPPVYLDRPTYQLQHEAVRWFDHWVKGADTGVMQEPPVRVFVMNTNRWKEAEDWPLPETRFTPFFLHEDRLLSEREHWPYEGSDSFEDSPWMRGALQYVTPPLVEDTEVIGPIMLKLYAATTETDVNWIVSLLDVNAAGEERLLTKGWLKGSHRELDMAKSKPWEPIHTHRRSEPLTPGEVYDFYIKLVPTANLFTAGSRIGLRIRCVDDEPTNALELIATGSLARSAVSRITVFHDEDHPSYLLLPITGGNVMNTFFSGGVFPG
jgi:putative CocE/NonD family hydrolase